MTSKVKPVLRWPGGKTRLLATLLPLIPAQAQCFVEVFAGSAALTLAKERHPVEVLNDLNGDIVALMRNAQFHLPALLEEMRWFVCARQNLKDFREQPGLTEIQKAARFLLRNRTSFGGSGTSFAVSKTATAGFDRDDVGSRLEEIRRRLNKVVVENLPYERCLANYDSKDTVFFLDPPYVGNSTGAYAAWEQSDMVALRGRLDRLQGRWLLTVNDSAENRKLFNDCQVKPVKTRNQRVNRRLTSDATFGELIICP